MRYCRLSFAGENYLKVLAVQASSPRTVLLSLPGDYNMNARKSTDKIYFATRVMLQV
ncbi:MAG: hypothetical protein ACTHLE_11830 [Agriterribacter sp.]